MSSSSASSRSEWSRLSDVLSKCPKLLPFAPPGRHRSPDLAIGCWLYGYGDASTSVVLPDDNELGASLPSVRGNDVRVAQHLYDLCRTETMLGELVLIRSIDLEPNDIGR